MLNSFAQHPFVNLFCGLILLLTSGYETWSTIEELTVGAHHGVFLFSIVQVLKTLPEMLQGTKEINIAKHSNG
jgi:hypothetical protein